VEITKHAIKVVVNIAKYTQELGCDLELEIDFWLLDISFSIVTKSLPEVA
jgi:hypothetical protein